ncbi:hypothetical protein EP331_10255 [bacterium]|nr:MAG: hypothetical protein EP331_10255 [bacterium]
MSRYLTTTVVIVGFWMVAIVLILGFHRFSYTGAKSIFSSDMIGYYSYLPAMFIYHDLDLGFAENNPNYPDDLYWKKTTPIGKPVIYYTYGMSLLYLPFFLVAHTLALIGIAPPNGFSWIYTLVIQLGTAGYTILGFFVLKKLLLRYFNERLTATALLILALGTPLFYYTFNESMMSHGASFMLFVGFFSAVDYWYSKPSFKSSIVLSSLISLIILVRPPNGIVIVWFVFWGWHRHGFWKTRIEFWWKNRKQVFIMLFVLAGFVFPQLLYWKLQSGSWFYKAYPDHMELDFLNPHLWNVLFSFRKGWLVYTPIMGIALLGFIFMKPMVLNVPRWLWVLFFCLSIWVISSWEIWWYGGSFGMRALIEYQAVLVFPMAFFIQRVMDVKKNVLRRLIWVVMGLFILLNIVQTFQYRAGIIHWDGMTYSVYKQVFGRLVIPKDELEQIHHDLDLPSYE